jgi:dolichyl-phosphate beta-glucosyltransferase
LSVIIPSFNEEAALAATVGEVVSSLRGRGHLFELIVVNDASRDHTADILTRLVAEHPEVRRIDFASNRGKGRAVAEGIRCATLPRCLFMDADNSTTIAEWPKFEEQFAAGFRAVVATRRLRGARIVVPQPLARRLLGGGYRVLCRWLFGLPLSDFNCGFKAYDTEMARVIYAQTTMTDWTFDVEVFCLLRRAGVDVAEVPVRWEHRDKTSHSAPLLTALRTLRSLVRLHRRERAARRAAATTTVSGP